MKQPSTSRVLWSRAIRLVESRYPPIDLFEDIADPADWELLASAESKTNPRLAETIGQLDKVPVKHRVSGPGASYVMAPFVHCSPDRPGRFHDGHFGAYYAANSFETALAETVHHQALRLADSADPPGWISEVRELCGELDATLVDIRSGNHPDLLTPGDYTKSQAFAAARRAAEEAGIAYPSVRNPGGECVALFWPDVPGIPVQGRHFRYYWDGTRINMIRELTLDGSGQVYELRQAGQR